MYISIHTRDGENNGRKKKKKNPPYCFNVQYLFVLETGTVTAGKKKERGENINLFGLSRWSQLNAIINQLHTNKLRTTCFHHFYRKQEDWTNRFGFLTP